MRIEVNKFDERLQNCLPYYIVIEDNNFEELYGEEVLLSEDIDKLIKPNSYLEIALRNNAFIDEYYNPGMGGIVKEIFYKYKRDADKALKELKNIIG